MLRLLYWLIKRRWAVCRECKYHRFTEIPLPFKMGFDPDEANHECTKYFQVEEKDYVRGLEGTPRRDYCIEHNKNGCCWGFKPKNGEEKING
jgi:hypothetical protein